MITKLSILPYSLKLSRPFSYATASLHFLSYAITKIEGEGVVGYGEVAAAWDVTGETQASAIGLEDYVSPLVLNKEINSVESIKTVMSNISREIAENYATKAGIEAALLDLLGKKKGLDICALFGAESKPISSQTVLSFGDFDKFLSGEFKILEPTSIKVKVGRNFIKEKIVLEKIREQFPNIPLNIDVNQGWPSYKEAIQKIKELESLKLSWVEQPLSAHDVYGLKRLKENISVPIMLDESCGTLDEVILFIEGNCGDMVNVKLAKCGGLLAAVEIFDWCKKHQVPYIIGDMIHSQLGTMMNLCAGLLGKPVTQDLTPLDRLADDPSSGIIVQDGGFILPKGPGLGINLQI